MGLIRALLGLALLLGPLAYLRRRSPLAPGWHPLLVLSSWTVLVLLGGIAGDLRIGVAVVVLAGLGLLACEVVVDRHNVVDTLRASSTLAFVLTGVGLALLLRGQIFTHYDNFSHWALVLEVMLADDSLPTQADPVVTFTTYPLGGASLAYLFTTVLGQGEWVAMAAQSLFIASCALPLVTMSARRRAAGLAVYLLGAAVLLTHVNSPSDLLVDGLVGGLGGSMLVLLLLRRDILVAHPWPLGVLGAALVTVKSSGLFFVAVATVLALALLWSARSQVRETGHRLAWAAALALPWLVWGAWGRHVATTFPAAGESKHSVSVGRFGAVLDGKTPADVRAILLDLLGATALDVQLWALVVGAVVAGALAFGVSALSGTAYRRLVVVVLATVLLWELSLALMYLFSMPLDEALVLAGFRRYQGTLHVVVALVALSALALWLGTVTRALLGRAAVGVLAGVAVVATTVPLVQPARLRAGSPETRLLIEQALDGVSVTPEDQVCLLQEKKDGGYQTWIARYTLQHLRVRSDVIEEERRALPGKLDRCDLFVLLDPRPHTAELLRDGGLTLEADPEVPVVISR